MIPVAKMTDMKPSAALLTKAHHAIATIFQHRGTSTGIYATEIQKLTDLNYSYTLRVLNALVNYRFMDTSKVGRLRIYTLTDKGHALITSLITTLKLIESAEAEVYRGKKHERNKKRIEHLEANN